MKTNRATTSALTVILLTGTLLMGVRAAAGPAYGQARDEFDNDLAVRFRGMAPSEDEDWDAARGLELQARFWDGGVGFALAAGIETWDAVSESTDEADAVSVYSSRIDGTASLVPVGASVLVRSRLTPALGLVFEGGVRYAFVQSSVDVSAYYEDAAGPVYAEDTIDIEDVWLGVIGLTLEASLTDSFSLTGGVDYRFGLGSVTERFLGESIGNTRLDAVAVTLGVALRF